MVISNKYGLTHFFSGTKYTLCTKLNFISGDTFFDFAAEVYRFNSLRMDFGGIKKCVEVV
jgi:hypothetical protein